MTIEQFLGFLATVIKWGLIIGGTCFGLILLTAIVAAVFAFIDSRRDERNWLADLKRMQDKNDR